MSELVLAAVPLGNVGDASLRLKEAIRSADVVAAEDSRRFMRLCKDLEIDCRAQLLSFFEGNEVARLDEIEAKLSAGIAIFYDGVQIRYITRHIVIWEFFADFVK